MKPPMMPFMLEQLRLHSLKLYAQYAFDLIVVYTACSGLI